MDGTAVAAHLHEKGGAYALDRRKQANNQAPKWHDLPLPRAPDSPTLRALLTMRCYPHIQATLHNVFH